MFSKIFKMSKKQAQALTILSLLMATEAFLFTALGWSSQFLETSPFHFFMESYPMLGTILYSITLFIMVTIICLIVSIFIWGFVKKPEPSEENTEAKIDILVTKVEALQKSFDIFIAIKEDISNQKKQRNNRKVDTNLRKGNLT